MGDKLSNVKVSVNGEEAKARIKEIGVEIEKLNRQKEKFLKEGKASSFDMANKEIIKLTKESNKLSKSVFDVNTVLKNLSSTSVRELNTALRVSSSELNRMKRNDPGFADKQNQVKLLRTELDKATAGGKKHSSMMSGLANGFNKYFTMATSFIAVLSGFAFSATQWIKGLAGMDDELANVMKTTQLTRKEVRELYTEFANLNTRTPRMELMELAEEAGRLGKRGKKDVMDFVEVANMIKVALGDELKGDAAEAIKEVGKLVTIYKVGEKNGIDYRESMLKVGSAINEVSASSQASAPFLIEMLKRMGGISDQADISTQSVIGYGAALDILGQTEEVSGTALNKTIINMFKDTATYAGIAKMGVNDFKQLLETDTNKAFIKFLEGLNGNNEGLSVMAAKFDGLGLDGARAIQVLASLASNTQLVREQQVIANRSFTEGTSLTNEYNIKNENMAANLDKIGRAMHAWFINSDFNKSLETTVNWFAKLVKVPVEKKFQDESREVGTLIGMLTGSNIKEADRLKILEELKTISPDIVSGLDAENLNYATLTKNVKAYNDELVKRMVLAQVTEKEQDILKKQAEARQTAIENAINAQDIMLTYAPEIAAQLNTVDEKIKQSIEFLKNKGASIQIGNEKNLINYLKLETDEIAKLDLAYTILVKSQEKRNEAINDDKNYEKELEGVSKLIDEYETLLNTNKEPIIPPTATTTTTTTTTTKTPETPEEKTARLAAEKLKYDSEKKAIESRIALMAEGYDKELAQLRQSYKDKREAIKQELAENGKLTPTDRTNLNTALTNSTALQAIEEQKLKDAQLVKEAQFQKQLTDLKLSYVTKGSEEEFALKQQAIDQQQIIELADVKGTEEEKAALKLEIIKKFEDQKADLIENRNAGLLDKAFTQKVTELISNNVTEFEILNDKFSKNKITEKKYNDQIKQLKEKFALESLMIAIQHAEDELKVLKASGEDIVEAEKQLAEMKLRAQESTATGNTTTDGEKKPTFKDIDPKDIANAGIDIAQNTADSIAQIKANARQSELDADLNALDILREKELSNKNLTEEEKEAIKENYRKKEAALRLAAWKKDQQAAVTQALINGALAITKTFATMGFVLGMPAAIAQAVATGLQIAVIKAQKPPQFRAGGFTEDNTTDDKPAGIVHANEFVANADATRNPSVRHVLDIIDYAQRSGSVRSINLPAVIASSRGYKDGGYVIGEGLTDSDRARLDGFENDDSWWSKRDPFLKSMKYIAKLSDVVDKLDQRLESLEKNGVKGNFVYQDFKNMADKEQKAISETN